jgi:hypothetical protein
MEEGGGETVEEIIRRYCVWRDRGKRELDDIVEHHAAVNSDLELHRRSRFGPNARLQPRWAGLIRLLFAADGVPTSREQVRSFQRSKLGRMGGTNSLLELLPLPSPHLDEWPYSRYSAIPCLQDRTSYSNAIAPLRVEHLTARIREHRPKLVLFYGLKYRDWWQQIAGTPFGSTAVPGFELATGGSTLFAMTQHPVTPGVSNQYYVDAGALIAAHC